VAEVDGSTLQVQGSGTQTAVTSENGTYRVPNLPPGTYTVRYELSGFKAVVLEGIRINLGGVVEQNVGLEIGQLADELAAELPRR